VPARKTPEPTNGSMIHLSAKLRARRTTFGTGGKYRVRYRIGRPASAARPGSACCVLASLSQGSTADYCNISAVSSGAIFVRQSCDVLHSADCCLASKRTRSRSLMIRAQFLDQQSGGQTEFLLRPWATSRNQGDGGRAFPDAPARGAGNWCPGNPPPPTARPVHRARSRPPE
jgi:hypothetical protein